MKPTHKITVFARSPHWQSSLRRQFKSYKLSWALDIEAALDEVACLPTTLAIVELSLAGIVTDCRCIAAAINGRQTTRVLAVGDGGLRPLLPAIRACGLTDVCCSLDRLPNLATLVDRHFQTLDDDQRTLEERVQQELPWKPIPNFFD